MQEGATHVCSEHCAGWPWYIIVTDVGQLQARRSHAVKQLDSIDEKLRAEALEDEVRLAPRITANNVTNSSTPTLGLCLV